MSLIFLIKFILASAIFYGVYKFVLENDTCHIFKRFYLIFSFIAAAIIPFININLPVSYAEQVTYPITYIQETFTTQATPVNTILTQSAEKISVNYWLIIYLIISAIFLFRFLKNIASLVLLIIKNNKVLENGTGYVLLNQTISPFSFLQYIFVNKEQFEKKAVEKEIIDHERAHISQRHSLDNIFFELITCFLWINPFVFLYTKAIKLNHEFLADRAVVDQNKNATTYLQLLLSKSIPPTSIQLTSSFNFLIIKKRITMITRKTSLKNSLLRRIVVLPIAFLSVYLFSNIIIAQQTSPATTPAQIENPSSSHNPEKKQLKKYVFFPAAKVGQGASEKEMEEYNLILKKIGKPDSDYYDWKNMDKIDGKKLQTIFAKMNAAQRSQIDAWVSSPIGPSAPSIPTQSQFESFKNASVYGVWVDGKKIANTYLDKYKASDFRHFSISKLYGAAKKGRSYTHQLDLMTIAYYEKYRKERLAENEEEPIIVAVPNERFKKNNGGGGILFVNAD